MMIGARTAAWAKSGAPLPYDAEVEWIQPATDQDGGVANARMSTGVTMSRDMTLEWCSALQVTPAPYVLIGPNSGTSESSVPATCIRHGGNVNTVQAGTCHNGWATQLSLIIRGRYVASISGPSFVINDLTHNVSCNSERDANELCFWGSPTAANNNTIRYEWLKIYDGDGALIRDFIPVRKDGLGYMFDRCGSISPVTGTSLYANEGASALLFGPDKTV